MSRPVRCRRCGAPFVPDRRGAMVAFWRLCPRCRGPLPPTSGAPPPDAITIRLWTMEAA